MKALIVVALLLIIGALATAGVALIRDGRDGKPKSRAMLHALTWRIGLSVALFICILLAYKFGWIQPTGVPRGQ